MSQPEFDYVVVGGGAAGCVLAARLAADSGCSVALIEQGRKDTNRWIHIPATFFKVLQSRDAMVVMSEPDPTLGDLPFPVPQGRVLGGGSSVNAMIYMRGQARDYDDWQNVHGCVGWAWRDVLPVFRRQEKNRRIDNEYHGTKGRLVVGDPTAPHPVSKALIEAAQSAGVPATDDFNGANQEGAGWYQVTADNGQRQSAAHCFLRPELHRENLSVLTDLRADRIRITGRRATALEARGRDGTPVVITARKEIILTAGSFQSPKLLLLSGIGPADILTRFGVDLVQDAPEVGANYQDHVGAPVTRRLIGAKGLHKADKGLNALRHGLMYLLARKGLLASNLLDAGACVDTGGSGRPDVQFNFAPFAPGAPGHPPLDFHALQVHPMTMRPKSRGRLTLASSNPADNIRFKARMLEEQSDIDTLRRGVRLGLEMLSQPGIRDIVGDAVWPGPDISTAAGTDALDAAIRRQARTIFHPAGTCRMGPDQRAVVDSKLRVNGVDNLRVADCSIMPALVSGNTNAPTMMIADRAADFILADG
jgi:choline dehydrogenase-like flavoprotein